MKKGTYLIFDRLFFLMNTSEFYLQKYMKDFEISKRAVFRDLEHLKLFYDIEFKYNCRLK